LSISVLAMCMSFIDEPDEQEKFQLIYERYAEDMLYAAYCVLKERSLAEDAVQNALIKISSVIKNIDMTNNPRAFAVTAARNEAKNIVKKYECERKYVDSYEEYYEECGEELCQKVEATDMAEAAARYVMKMGPEYYEVFILRFLHDMQYKEIEKMLDVSESALRKRMQRVKERLKDHFKKGEE